MRAPVSEADVNGMRGELYALDVPVDQGRTDEPHRESHLLVSSQPSTSPAETPMTFLKAQDDQGEEGAA